jgi:hypothetical protein
MYIGLVPSLHNVQFTAIMCKQNAKKYIKLNQKIIKKKIKKKLQFFIPFPSHLLVFLGTGVKSGSARYPFPPEVPIKGAFPGC